MKIKILLPYLIALLIILVTIDILTGIWFWNRENLYFDSINFNNIVTPLLTLIAIIIYGVALNTSMKQNKIILSQSLKPQYDELIHELTIKGRKKKRMVKVEGVDFSYSPSDYITKIMDAINMLRNNDEYIEDIHKHRNGEKGVFKNFTKKSYHGIVLFLSEFSIGINPVSFFHQEIKGLIQEIDKSQLIEQDKELLRKKIARLFLEEYMSFIELEKSSISLSSGIPIFYDSNNILDKEREISIKHLSDTSFGDHYDWFKKNLIKCQCPTNGNSA